MNFASILREIARGADGARDLSSDEAYRLYGAILDGGVAELELGAILIALRVKGETIDEMAGFLAATGERLHALRPPPGRLRPIVIPSYNGARRGANLTPLLALLLQRFAVPVLIHGLIEGYGRVTSAQILREFGIAPCLSRTQAQQAIDARGLAYLPLPLISSALSDQLALRSRLGLRNTAHSLVKLIDPFRGSGLLVTAATHPDYIDMSRTLLASNGSHALLLRATEGEPYANPQRRPRIEHLHDGECEILFEAEKDSLRSLPNLPDSHEARPTADWMRRVLAGEIPLPQPIANQLAACLYASGYAEDLNQAKAIVAVDGAGAVHG